ncbi:MAG: MotE family protein [Myxococcota bacterium]
MTRLQQGSVAALAALWLVPAVAAADAGATPASRDASAAALMLELRIERAALERRAFELETRERALAEAQGELLRRLEQFEATRADLEKRLDRLEESMGDQTARLSKTYAAMPPERAAILMAELDPEFASSILRRMRSKQSAAVLADMEPGRARTLSIRLAKPLTPVAEARPATRPRRGGQR